ncbi:MAG: PocR ligand-binding domain-containing protein [Clostridia bacterium]|nr:PocR ligand-binding domain-containing protein [Clostridia bacterium]
MTTRFDVQYLLDVMSKFYLLTGIKIVVMDADLNTVAAMPTHDSAFCSILKQHPAAATDCQRCTQAACLHSKEAKQVYLYRCHAGLIEAVAPLFINETLVGYIILGQILHEEDANNNKNRILSYVSTYTDDALSALEALTVKNEEHIQAAVKIMEICAHYLLMQSHIHLDKETLALQIEEYIDANLTSPLSVEVICEKFSLSHNMLYKLFEKFFGMPVAKYIRKKRIKAAKALIRAGVSVTDASSRVGFLDYSYFSKVFKAETGMLPTKFRKKETDPPAERER